jgi:tetratricopeptide (TPR) repeat protein
MVLSSLALEANMKGLLSLTAGLASLMVPSALSATSLSVGNEMTNACFEAASIKRANDFAISRCSLALRTEASTGGDRRVATLVNRGILLMLNEQSASATRDFDEAISIDPTESEAWLGKAVEAWKAGEDRSAVGFANRALELRTERPALAYFVRGLANEGMGNVRGAYSDLNTARSLDPRWSEPAAQLARYKVIRR